MSSLHTSPLSSDSFNSPLVSLSSFEFQDDFKVLKVNALQDLPSVWTLEFDHGKANEVGSQVLHELDLLVNRLNQPNGPVALISFSQRKSKRGTPIFISGANVVERVGWSDDQVKAHVRRQRELLSRLRYAPVFHVCVVNGVTLGWGTEFLITADYKISLDSARFGLPETGLGILPGAGGTSELSSLIGPAHTLRLGMTGEQIFAEEALRIGLIQECCPDLETALQRAYTLCQLTTKKSPTALAAFKHALLSSLGESSAIRKENEALAYEVCVDAGQAAIGRRDFDLIRQGQSPDWGKRHSNRFSLSSSTVKEE
jgi:enoyl-CoA hydratase/carnithine racemase